MGVRDPNSLTRTGISLWIILIMEMSGSEAVNGLHPLGEQEPGQLEYPAPHRVTTPGGTMQVSWEPDPGINSPGLPNYFWSFSR